MKQKPAPGKAPQQIRYEMLAYIKEFDPVVSNWFVGISIDAKQSLLGTHGVRESEDPWLYNQIMIFRAARTVQSHFNEHLRVQRNVPDAASEDFDYLYMMNEHTRQWHERPGRGQGRVLAA